jgi:aminobenzoyl-glutamate transport protein
MSGVTAGVAGSQGGEGRGIMQRALDVIERAGNKVPNPVLLFLYLILLVIILSAILAWAGVSVTEQIAEPVGYPVQHNYYEDTTQVQSQVPPQGNEYSNVQFTIREETIPVRSLLTIDGIRFIFTSFVANLQNFGVIAVVLIAMMGAGVAEGSGLLNVLIHRLVAVAPSRLITFLVILAGGLASVTMDAGYLILIPLAASVFFSLRRNPLVGLAAGFVGVGGTFGVNLIIQPTDAMITEIANEAIGLTGGQPITVANNFFFSAASLIILCVVATFITERMTEPRLGAYDFTSPEAIAVIASSSGQQSEGEVAAAEARGLRFALFGFLAILVIVLLATLPPGAPLRNPQTGDIIGNSPFMDSLLFIIVLFFLAAGIGYGVGARTFTSANDVIATITRTYANLGELILMLLMIAQFIAYFNYSNMPQVTAVSLADLLERAAVPPLLLLIGFVLVIFLLTFIIPCIVPKWAIFAPVFIPIFLRLGIGPQTVLAAYRIGDSPPNVLTPLMVYFPFIVTLAQRYRKDSGLGTIISMTLPYALIMLVVWILLFALWFAFGIPLGPGYPVRG